MSKKNKKLNYIKSSSVAEETVVDAPVEEVIEEEAIEEVTLDAEDLEEEQIEVVEDIVEEVAEEPTEDPDESSVEEEIVEETPVEETPVEEAEIIEEPEPEIVEEPIAEEPIEEAIEEVVEEEPEIVEEKPPVEEEVEEIPEPVVEPEPLPEQNITEIIADIKVPTENITTLYRVRKSWEDMDTQLYATPDRALAISKAEGTPGYKVFVGDDGELFYDPNEEIKDSSVSIVPLPENIKPVNIPIPGGKLILRRCPVYSGPRSDQPYKYATGIYYYYDNTIINNRAKITENANITTDSRKNPSMIYGYINI